MRRSVFILSLFLFCCFTNSFSQSVNVVDSLNRIYSRAANDTDRIYALNSLANYYFNKQMIGQADSILNQQLRIANLLDNKELLLVTYFDNPAADINPWSPSEDFNKVIGFIQNGIDYAKKANEINYVVLGYVRLAAVMRIRGKYTESLNSTTLAFTNMQLANDSTKAVVYIELGNYWLTKGEFVTASTNYNNAFYLADQMKNYHLQTDIYRCLANLNEKINEETDAKDFILKCVQIDKKFGNGVGLIKDYIQLGRLDRDEFYLNQVISMSDSLHLTGYSRRAREILLAIYLRDRQHPGKALVYFDSQPELQAFYQRTGMEYYYYERGTIHFLTNNPDSSLFYFTRVEPYMLKNYDIKVASSMYLDFGDCYSLKRDWPKAIEYYLKSLSYFQQTEEIGSILEVSETLSSFYKENGNFERSLFYKEFSTNIKDSLSKLTKSKEVALLNVERLKKQEAEELHQKEIATTRKRNLQYIAITIAICIVFIGMLVLGMFPISKVTIRLLGYFFFISLFEFIVLVLDNNILHTITHGEPLKLWLIKIALIGLLVPIQHFMERRITKFLESRQLLKARRSFSFKNFWAKRKIRMVKTDEDTEDIEKDTAVL